MKPDWMALGWKEALRQTAGYSRLLQGADAPAFPQNLPDSPDQENTRKVASVGVWLPPVAMLKQVRHSWGRLCFPAAKDSHTARSVDQTYWTSPYLPFFNQSVIRTKRVRTSCDDRTIIVLTDSAVNTTRKANELPDKLFDYRCFIARLFPPQHPSAAPSAAAHSCAPGGQSSRPARHMAPRSRLQ